MQPRPAELASHIRRKYRLARDGLKRFKRQTLRAIKTPKLAIEYAAYRRAIGRRDWPSVRSRAKALTQMAVGAKDRRMVLEMMHALERLECFEESSQMYLAWRDLMPERAPNPWRGEDLAGKSLLIDFMDPEERGLGLACRGASLVAEAVKVAGSVSVRVEPRMVPIYRRTFPRSNILDDASAVDERRFDFVAAMGRLAAYLGPKEDHFGLDFHGLQPDPARTAELRTDYLGRQPGPLVGLFWFSSHHGKELPDLPAWKNFIDSRAAQFVSLQYGDVEQEIGFLGRDRVLVDANIDQLVDMDAFAAQVAALDAVIAISGTAAHLAGALNVPTVVLRDDWFRRIWPVMNDRTPWYPRLRVVGKDGRDWETVMDEAWSTMQSLLADGIEPRR